MTVGERLGSGYLLESIPVGISLETRGQGRLDVYLNHETSLVPFPFDAATGVGQSDYTNAMLSHLTLSQHSAGVLQGRYVIPSSANFQRFCSNFLAEAGTGNGFEGSPLFTNEEATDFVNRTGVAWPPGPDAEQAGLVVAYDPQRHQYRPIYGMGRHNHENSVAVPGYGHPVLLSGDDTFSAPASQVYLYRAASAAAVWNDEGSLERGVACARCPVRVALDQDREAEHLRLVGRIEHELEDAPVRERPASRWGRASSALPGTRQRPRLAGVGEVDDVRLVPVEGDVSTRMNWKTPFVFDQVSSAI